MSQSPRPFPALWVLVAMLLLLGGCLAQTKTATLYSLQLLPQQPLPRQPKDRQGMVLLMPVQVAPHLQGRNLLYQQPTGEARAASGHLWSATLDRQIGQRMTVALQQLLATDNVALYPGPRFGVIRSQVEIEVQEFSGDGHTFTTLATYTISDTTAKTILTRKTFHQNRPIDKPGYSGYADSASRAVADLSREVALSLLAAGPPPTRHGTTP